MTKLYCVHVFPRPYQYENVEAESASEAEEKVIAREYRGDYNDIQNVEVMETCTRCHYDNEVGNVFCAECGVELSANN